MKTLTFDTIKEANSELDGKIFKIATADNSNFLCNLLEEDFDFLMKAGEIECVYETEKKYKGHVSDYALRDKFRSYETMKRSVDIIIIELQYDLTK
jgi:hypothetical protein